MKPIKITSYNTWSQNGTFIINITHNGKKKPISIFLEDEFSSKPLFTINRYSRLFIGDNLFENPLYLREGAAPGNSLLISFTDYHYLYVGHEIFLFTTSDRIVSYASPIGHGMPTPYAIGEENVYFMLEKQCVPSFLFKNRLDDVYSIFYKNKDVQSQATNLKLDAIFSLNLKLNRPKDIYNPMFLSPTQVKFVQKKIRSFASK